MGTGGIKGRCGTPVFTIKTLVFGTYFSGASEDCHIMAKICQLSRQIVDAVSDPRGSV